MDASSIIERLGGTRKVAEITGAKRNAVSQWLRIGIPAKYWPALVKSVSDDSLTFEQLQATKPAPQSAAA